jgi:hypothetical protein
LSAGLPSTIFPRITAWVWSRRRMKVVDDADGESAPKPGSAAGGLCRRARRLHLALGHNLRRRVLALCLPLLLTCIILLSPAKKDCACVPSPVDQ